MYFKEGCGANPRWAYSFWEGVTLLHFAPDVLCM